MVSLLAIVLSQTCEPTGEFVCRSGDQSVGGIKTHAELLQAMASYPVGGSAVGVYSPSGVATKTIVAPVAGEAVTLKCRLYSSNPGACVTIEDDGTERAGYQLSVKKCGTQVYGVTTAGDVHFGAGFTTACAADPAAGSLVDIGPGGHVALRRGQPGQYLALRGSEGNGVDAVNEDDSEPTCDGGRWTFMTDAGCRYHPASGHGSVDLGDGHARWQGQVLELNNPRWGNRHDHVAYFSANGGYWQNHGLKLETFPPPGTTLETNQGTFFVDAQPGEMLWDQSRGRWYFMKPGEDAGWVQGYGAGYVQFAEQPSVVALLSAYALLEARVAALEAVCP